jgi:hypothetical protein
MMNKQEMAGLIRHLAKTCRPSIEQDDCEVRPATHWGMSECYYGLLPKGLLDVPPYVVDWLRSCGCIVQTSDKANRIVITPIVYVEPPRICHHATPYENRENIEAKGLSCGRLAGRSTTKRKDAAEFIHVCFTRKACQRWINSVFPVSGVGVGRWWAIFEIDLSRFGARVFRDPASSTGYIIEADHIPPGYLTYRFGWD